RRPGSPKHLIDIATNYTNSHEIKYKKIRNIRVIRGKKSHPVEPVTTAFLFALAALFLLAQAAFVGSGAGPCFAPPLALLQRPGHHLLEILDDNLAILMLAARFLGAELQDAFLVNA